MNAKQPDPFGLSGGLLTITFLLGTKMGSGDFDAAELDYSLHLPILVGRKEDSPPRRASNYVIEAAGWTSMRP